MKKTLLLSALLSFIFVANAQDEAKEKFSRTQNSTKEV